MPTTLDTDDKKRFISDTIKGASLGGVQQSMRMPGGALPGDEPPSGPPGVKLAPGPGGDNIPD